MNKIFKSTLVAFVAITGLTMTSCVNEYEYDGAAASGEQVYFGSDMAATVETPKSANSFSVMVRRINTSGSLTVPVTITMSLGCIYTPTAQQVTFADGAAEAPLVFTYNPDDVVYGTYYDITIQLNDPSLGSAYGVTSYSFKAGATAWVAWGTATYRESFVGTFFGVEDLMYDVKIERNTVQPGMYRLVNAYGKVYPYNADEDYDASQDYYLTINAMDPNAVYIEKSPSGMDWGYGEFIMWSIPAYFMENNGLSLEEAKAQYGSYFGTLEDGVIYMPDGSLLMAMANYQSGNFYQRDKSAFAVALPGYAIADLSAEVEYTGIFTDAANQVFAVGNLTLGEDATNVKAVVVPADADADAVADAVAAGDLESIEVSAGSINVPIPEDMTGKLQIVVVVMDKNDAVKTVATAKFEYYGGGANPWKSLGVGYYTDDFVVPFYGTRDEEGNFIPYDPYTYKVEIEESTDTPGLLRIKNAYAGVAQAFQETGGEKDIEIHAENPNGVYFRTQPIGLDFGNGEFSIVSYGGDDVEYFESKAGATPEEVIAAYPEDFGTLKDGVITLANITATDSQGNPVPGSDGNPVMFQGYLSRSDGKIWYSCTNLAFKLVLPTASAEVIAQAKRAAAATSFENRLYGGVALKYAPKDMRKNKNAKAFRTLKNLSQKKAFN